MAKVITRQQPFWLTLLEEVTVQMQSSVPRSGAGAAAVVLALVVAACGTGSATPAPSVGATSAPASAAPATAAPTATPEANSDRPEGVIHVYVLGDAAASAEQAAADRFNQTSDVKVVIDTGPTAGVEYTNTVRSLIGTTNGPDVFMSWGAANIKPMVDAGALMSIDDFVAADPQLKSAFLPSVFNEEILDGKAYGVPMRGVAPVFLFYNKTVLDAAGLKPATTWSEIVSQTATLKAAKVIPFALGGRDKWPTLMWFEYAISRAIGNEAVAKGLAGDDTVWASEGTRQALADLRQLIDAGGFGTTFDSVAYSGDGTTALLVQGKAAYELMGTWDYSVIQAAAPEFAASQLGWAPFPGIDGGAGAATEISGNLSNFYNVAANTRYPDAVRGFLQQLYGDPFVNDQIALGNLPPTTSAASLIQAATDIPAQKKEYLGFIIDLVQEAPSFQLSWDQAVPATSSTDLNNAMSDFFSGAIDADGWISAMQGLR